MAIEASRVIATNVSGGDGGGGALPGTLPSQSGHSGGGAAHSPIEEQPPCAPGRGQFQFE